MWGVDLLAVLLAALSAFVLGGLWYSLLFGKAWMRATGQPEETLKSGHPAAVFGGAFVLNLVAAFILAKFMGGLPLLYGAIYGLTIGLCWVATSFGVCYLFERRSFALWLINAGYFTLQFTAMGAIIGAFNGTGG